MPVPSEQRDEVSSVYEPSAAALNCSFSASYANVPPKQLLDLVLMSGRTAEISFRGADGTKGRIDCVAGKVDNVFIDGARGIEYLEEVLEILSVEARVKFSALHPSTLGGALVSGLVPYAEGQAIIKVRGRKVKPPEVKAPPSPVDRRARGAALAALLLGLMLLAYVARMETRVEVRATDRAAVDPSPKGEGPSGAEAPLPQHVASLLARPLEPERDLILELETEPADAEIWLDGVLVGQGRVAMSVWPVDSSHEVKVVAEGFIPRHLTFSGTAPPPLVSLVPLDSPVASKAVRQRAASRRKRRRARRMRKQSRETGSAIRPELNSPPTPRVEVIGDAFPEVELIGDSDRPMEENQ